MKNQHEKITGYRDLTQGEIDLMNKIKAHAAETEKLLAKVQSHVSAQFDATRPTYAEPKNADEEVIGTECTDTPEQSEAKALESARLKYTEPFRWHALGKTHLQQGFMALTRAVAQPTTF